MFEQIREAPLPFKSRAAGVFYLLSVFTAIFAEAFLRGRLLHVVGLIPVVCFTIVTLLLYSIFAPVNRRIALMAAFTNLIGLAFEAFEWHLPGVNAALVFHGIYCLLMGYLVFKSTFLPRILGVLMAFAGLAWLLTSLSPHLTRILHSYTQTLGFLGEGVLMLWLLVLGVNIRKWIKKADARQTNGARLAS